MIQLPHKFFGVSCDSTPIFVVGPCGSTLADYVGVPYESILAHFGGVPCDSTPPPDFLACPVIQLLPNFFGISCDPTPIFLVGSCDSTLADFVGVPYD